MWVLDVLSLYPILRRRTLCSLSHLLNTLPALLGWWVILSDGPWVQQRNRLALLFSFMLLQRYLNLDPLMGTFWTDIGPSGHWVASPCHILRRPTLATQACVVSLLVHCAVGAGTVESNPVWADHLSAFSFLLCSSEGPQAPLQGHVPPAENTFGTEETVRTWADIVSGTKHRLYQQTRDWLKTLSIT